MIERARLRAIAAAQAVRSSFWFVPAVISLGAIALAWLTIRSEDLGVIADFAPRSSFTPDGARTILATIAGAVMTVGGVVFSLTIVALSVVAQQLGPRVVTMLMRERTTQITLGVFNATFLHALITLTATSSTQDNEFVPSLAVLTAVGLAIASFALLIWFVHSMAMNLQADAVISHLSEDLDEAIDKVALADPESGRTFDAGDLEEAVEVRRIGAPVGARGSGYVQSIDIEAAVRIASGADARVAFVCGPGDFVLEGAPLLACAGAPEAGACIAETCAQLGPQRGSVGNVSFEIDALVDVALRALSPSLNDPHTALTCADRLCEALLRLSKGPLKSIRHDDATGAPRVYERPRTFADRCTEIFLGLAPAASDSPIAREGLAAVLDSLISTLDDAEARRCLHQWRSVVVAAAEAPRAGPLPPSKSA